MRLAVITQDEFFYIPLFFRKLLAALDTEKYQVESIVVLPAFNESMFRLVKRTYNFYGALNFLRQGTKYGVIRSLDKLRLATNTVASLARKHGIELISLYPEDLINPKKLEKKLSRMLR